MLTREPSQSISDKKHVNVGCPQGSILGPLIFCIFVNDLYLILQNCIGVCYADDTTLLCSDHNPTNVISKLKQDIGILLHWFRASKLSLNLGKTQHMIFNLRSKKFHPSSTLDVDGVAKDRIKSFKCQGIILDDELSWDQHVNFL